MRKPPATPRERPRDSGYQSERAACLLARADHVMALFSEVAQRSDSLLVSVREIVRSALVGTDCLLASQVRGDAHTVATLIPSDTGDGTTPSISANRLTELFALAFATDDATYCEDLTTPDQSPMLCAGISLDTIGVESQNLKEYRLLLAVFGPCADRDPDFPGAQFLTFDEFFLRIALRYLGIYVMTEYRARRQTFRTALARGGGPALAATGESMLEFEYLLGLPTDSVALCRILAAKRDAFAAGLETPAQFHESLGRMPRYIARISAPTDRQQAASVLFECNLVLMTKRGDTALLSERIRKAAAILDFHGLSRK
jgi:hypothetical protein